MFDDEEIVRQKIADAEKAKHYEIWFATDVIGRRSKKNYDNDGHMSESAV